MRFLALSDNLFDPTAPQWYTYSITTGLEVDSFLFEDPPLAFPASIYPFVQRLSDKAILCTGNSSTQVQDLIIFDQEMNFVSDQVLTPPSAGVDNNAPYLFTDSTGGLFGLWTNAVTGGGSQGKTIFVELNPLTFAQTTLWNDFQLSIIGGLPIVDGGCDISSDGSKFYFFILPGVTSPTATELRTLYQLDVATGVVTTFIDPGSGLGRQALLKPISCSSDRVFVPWNNGTGLEVIVYESDGSIILDLDLSATYSGGTIGPDVDGEGFWLLAQAADLTYSTVHYTIGGVLDIGPEPITVPVDTTFFQAMLSDIIDSGSITVTSIVPTRSEPGKPSCDQLVITGTFFPDDAEGLTIKGPDDEEVSFVVVSSSDTVIVVGTLDPAYSDGEYCVAFEPFESEPEWLLCSESVCTPLPVSSGIYFLDPAATHDTLYLTYVPVTTVGVKIP